MTDSAGEPATDGTARAADDEAYSGVFGAFPYAYRSSESRLFRTYVVGGGLLAAAVVVLFALAIVVLVGNSATATGGTFTFSRALFLFLMLLVVAPLVAPVLAVARRHRRRGSDIGRDRALAAGGYLFVFSLYLGLVISSPEALREDPSGALAPLLDALYSLPRLAGFVPPLLAVALLVALYRRYP